MSIYNGSTNGSVAPSTVGRGFLSFDSQPPRLYITSEDEEFDDMTLEHWKEEGFTVEYIPMLDGGKPYIHTIKSLANNLKLSEHYALIAYGDAATICLEVALKPLNKCCALIAYYPTNIPHPHAKYPTSLNLVVHLTSSQGLKPSYPHYIYPGVESGFAEHDLDVYDRVSASLAWTRDLTALRKGFKNYDNDIESVRNDLTTLSLRHRDAAGTIGLLASDSPYVNNIPTMTGGIGKRALFHFYNDFFIPGNPASLRTQLVSRTVGVNRVVDEMIISFKHTIEMPWILPGVPATNKNVTIALASIITVRGGKLEHEHVYWDQASVLAQIGAIDAAIVPKDLKGKGCTRLPIVGAEAAKKVLDVDKVPSNELIDDW